MRTGEFVTHWTRAQFSVLLARDEWLRMEARMLIVDGIVSQGYQLGIHFRDRFCDVTHVPSGQRIAGDFISLGHAVDFAERVLPLTNWSAIEPDLTPVIRSQVKAFRAMTP